MKGFGHLGVGEALLAEMLVDLLGKWHGKSHLYLEATMLLQLATLSLSGNRLNGTLPRSWSANTQASHASKTASLTQSANKLMSNCYQVSEL